MAIAKHEPSKLYSRNKGMKKMTKEQLREFAGMKEKGLPKRVKKQKKCKTSKGKGKK